MSSRGYSDQRGRPPFRGGPGRGRDQSSGRGSPVSSSDGRGSRGSGGGGGRGDRGQRGGYRGGPRGGGPGGGPVIFNAGTPAQVDQQLVPEGDKLINSFKKLPSRAERPARPGYGTLGTKVTLRANFFAVKLPKGPFYEYDVDFTPKTDINRIKGRLFQLLEQSAQMQPYRNHIAHDRSKKLVSAQKLPQPFDVQIPFLEDGQTTPSPGAKTYTVSIKLTVELNTQELTKYLNGQLDKRDYNPLPIISALNLVLQQHAARTGGVRVGRNRYFFPSSGGEKFSLGKGVEALKGFFISVRPSPKSLLANINACMSAFYEPGNMANILKNFNQYSSGAMPSLPPAFAKEIKITTRHLGYRRQKALRAVGTTSARNTFFDCQEFGGRISVEQYFKRKYKITLKHPADLPVLDIGSKEKPNHVPAELCEIEAGLPYFGRLDDMQTRNMLRFACNPPATNASLIINEGFPKLGIAGPNTQPPVTGFGLGISTEMTVVPGRELPPPQPRYKVGRADLRDGSWNILGIKFHKGAKIDSWWVLVVRDGQEVFQGSNDPILQGLVKGFGNKMADSGMTVPRGMPRLLVTDKLVNVREDPSRLRAINTIRMRIQSEVDKHGKPSFILVLLSGRDNYIYPAIKRIGDVELGIHTIHMLAGKALGDERKQDQYFSNVALKANTKLGGVNHLLDDAAMKWLTKESTMMVGIDVTHPGVHSIKGTPSIAAVVANVDKEFAQFPASMRIQKGKQEMLSELRDMLVERLLAFERHSSALPTRVFVFRDGVSESQFDIVLEHELPQILEAFKKFDTEGRGKPYRPKLSIVICGKRHHARFFPTNSTHAARNGNTRPGTVVDRGVTAIFDFDFYLQAHAGLQGTVRPTHYTVVYDENKFSADDIQGGINNASYLYARATKAVSLIPAAYYADLACERGRCYLNDFLNLSDGKSTSGGSKKGKDRDAEMERVFNEARNAWGEGIHRNLRDAMFYI